MDKVVNKAKDLVKISELNLRIMEKEAMKSNLTLKLGKEVYGSYPAVNLASVAEVVEEIKKIDEEVAVLNDAIIAIKGLQKCPACEALVKDDMKFCGQCGAKLVHEEPAEPAPEKEIIPEEPPVAE